MNIFDIQKKHQNRVDSNYFDLSHTHKTSMHFGKLYPVLVEETLPGDRWTMQTSKMVRALPMESPMMHNVIIEEQWFYVPLRILWEGWEEFITVRQETTVRIMPQIGIWDDSLTSVGNLTRVQRVGVYMGLPHTPTVGENGFLVSAFPLAAYVQIWNNYYRNSQITQELQFKLKDGVNIYETDIPYTYENAPLTVLWRRDYFMSALPSPTLGIDVPILNDNRVILDDDLTGFNKVLKSSRTNITADVNVGALNSNKGLNDLANAQGQLVIDPNGQWMINAGTIETLKAAFALQSYLEKEVKAGGLYKDNIAAHWGVELPDYRVQLPEYIGSVYQNLVVSEVLSTTENPSGINGARLGEMGGHGISTKQSGKMQYTTYEHGILMCCICIKPDFVLNPNGIHRKWRRVLREDYPNPAFANLGDQAILNTEIHWDHTNPDGVFGYVPRYSEMKYAQSRTSGEMADSLAFWHLAQSVSRSVSLNNDFLYIQNPWDLDRIFRVQDLGVTLDNFVVDIYFDITVNRKLPRYQLPTTLLHS